MNSIYWTALQSLNQLTQLMQDSLVSFLEDCQQSTLWIGHTDEVAVAAIAIHETKNELFIEVHLPDADGQTLDVEFTEGTALVRGKWIEKREVKGYFHPGQFQTLIPLPYPVQPESVSAEFKNDVLKFRLLKQRSITQYKVRVALERSSVALHRREREGPEPKKLRG